MTLILPASYVARDDLQAGPARDAWDGVQQNFDRLAAAFPVGGDKLLGSVPSATAPANPQNGQDWFYIQDGSAGIIWHFKYLASVSGSYKWVFVGGASMMSDFQATGTETTTSTTYTELTTTGPAVTIPLAGDYMVEYGVQYFTNTAFAGNFSALWLGTSSVIANSSCGGTPDVANEVHTAFRQREVTGLSASQDLRMRYLVTAGTGSFGKRAMRVTPIRVAG